MRVLHFYLSTMGASSSALPKDYIVATDDKTSVLVRRDEVGYYDVSILKSRTDGALIIHCDRPCLPF